MVKLWTKQIAEVALKMMMYNIDSSTPWTRESLVLGQTGYIAKL